MKINKEIIDILNEKGLYKNDIIMTLLSIYFNLDTKLISNDLKEIVYGLNIISKNGKWNYRLLEKSEIDITNFQWVEDEYIPLFKLKGRGGYCKEAKLRMATLFKENKDLTKESILSATESYLSKCKYPKFIMLPHYFIQKGVGANKKNTILTFIENNNSQEQDAGKIHF